MFQKKQITEQQALSKLTGLCARAEHCSGEMLDKMRQWGVDEEAQARIMEYLIKNKFVDDERFARFFINDKIKYNGWGRRKIEQALWMKHIDRTVYDPIFDEVDPEEYLAQLRPIIKQKLKTTKANSDYERSMKVIKNAMSRGFEIDLIRKCIDNAELLDETY